MSLLAGYFSGAGNVATEIIILKIEEFYACI